MNFGGVVSSFAAGDRRGGSERMPSTNDGRGQSILPRSAPARPLLPTAAPRYTGNPAPTFTKAELRRLGEQMRVAAEWWDEMMEKRNAN